MATVKDADKFLGSEVKRWKRKAFISHFYLRWENAEEIYDYHVPPKKKKVEKKED